MSFTDDPEEEPPEMSFERRQELQAKADLLEAAAHKIGLHSTSTTLGAAVDPETGQPARLVLMMQFAIGDLAFTDRVQDPRQAVANDEIAKIEHDLTPDTADTRASLEALRERMQKKGNNGPEEANPPEA